MITIESLMVEAEKIHKSAISETTKDFVLFVITQLAVMDKRNSARLVENAKTDRAERLKEWHENGSIFYEMPIKNGLRHGSFQMWQPNGKRMCEIPFVNGLIDGVAVLYKKEGIEELAFKDGHPISLDK